MANRPLTELEGCVLGVLWAAGDCTAYSVRQVFLASPSPHWSGSAGAIYPLLLRLEKRRFVRSKPAWTGRRASSRYTLTPLGRNALRRWVGPQVPDWVTGVPADPLRTRLRFLGALSPAARAEFLAAAETKMREQLRRVEENCAATASGDPDQHLMAKGARAALRARLEWLREIIAWEKKRTAVLKTAGRRLRLFN